MTIEDYTITLTLYAVLIFVIICLCFFFSSLRMFAYISNKYSESANQQ